MYLVKKSHIAKNPKNHPLGSLNVFYKPKTSKNAREYPVIKFENFRKTNAKCRKKTKGDPLVSPVLLEALKKLWFSARIEPTLSGFRKLVEVEQIVKSGPFRMRLSVEKKTTRRERPKSAPYLRLKNIQGTTIGKIWKNFFFQKN